MAKEWAWSFSKFKNWLTCPKRYYEIDVQKNFVDESEALTWGNTVHAAMAAAALLAKGIPFMGTGRDKVTAAPLPETMGSYQKWIDVVKASPGRLLVEQKFSITRDLRPVSWFDNQTWYRGVCDLLMIHGNTATALDWKTGKIKHDSVQLMLMALCIFLHHPEITLVKTRFVWLQEDCTTPEQFTRDEIMKQLTTLIPQVNELEKAHQTLTFPPKPGKLCRKWCPVTSCPFYKKGA